MVGCTDGAAAGAAVAVVIAVAGLPNPNIAGTALVTAMLGCVVTVLVSVFANVFAPKVGAVNVGNVALLVAFDRPKENFGAAGFVSSLFDVDSLSEAIGFVLDVGDANDVGVNANPPGR